MKSKRALILLTVIIGLIVVFVIAVKLVLPDILKKKILSAVNDRCSDCALQMKSVDIGLLPPGIFTFHDVRVEAGQGGRSMIEARVGKLTANLSLSSSSRHKLTFKEIQADDVSIIYSEGDAKKVEPPAKSSGDSIDFVIDHTTVTGAVFRYTNTQHHVTSILHARDLKATLGQVGTPQDIRNEMSEAHIAGQIEKSGHAELTIAALTRPGPNYVDVLFQIDDQNLEDANTFFTPNDGLTFHGKAHHLLAKVNVRDQQAKSHVRAVYENAELSQKPTATTNPLEAIFVNLGAALIMSKSNVGRVEADQTAAIESERKSGEALVHFILRAFRESLLEIAKKKDSRAGEPTKK